MSQLIRKISSVHWLQIVDFITFQCDGAKIYSEILRKKKNKITRSISPVDLDSIYGQSLIFDNNVSSLTLETFTVSSKLKKKVFCYLTSLVWLTSHFLVGKGFFEAQMTALVRFAFAQGVLSSISVQQCQGLCNWGLGTWRGASQSLFKPVTAQIGLIFLFPPLLL